MTDTIGFVALYRWRLVPGREEAFVAAWSEVTQALLACGSYGSRLHLGDDGLWYGYAQWPDADARRRAFAAAAVDSAPLRRMRECVAESLPEIVLTPMADWLRLPHNRPF